MEDKSSVEGLIYFYIFRRINPPLKFYIVFIVIEEDLDD